MAFTLAGCLAAAPVSWQPPFNLTAVTDLDLLEVDVIADCSFRALKPDPSSYQFGLDTLGVGKPDPRRTEILRDQGEFSVEDLIAYKEGTPAFEEFPGGAKKLLTATDGGNGVEGANKTNVPFPIPETGVEVVWNHNFRDFGGSIVRESADFPVQTNGTYTLGKRIERIAYASYMDDAEPAYVKPFAVENSLRASWLKLVTQCASGSEDTDACADDSEQAAVIRLQPKMPAARTTRNRLKYPGRHCAAIQATIRAQPMLVKSSIPRVSGPIMS